MNLYRFYWDCGRMGSVEGLFVANKEDIEKRIGKRVYFGEILGKHSEIRGDLSWDDLELVSDDHTKVKWLEKIIGDKTISGYNPLSYIRVNCYNCDIEVIDGDWTCEHKIVDGEYWCMDCYHDEIAGWEFKYEDKEERGGELFTVEEFKKQVELESFIDYDGHGYNVKNNKIDNNVRVLPSKIDHRIDDNADHILWFNR